MPVVDTIKRHQPQLTIGWVVRRRCATLLRGNPSIDHLYVLGEKFHMGELLALRRQLRADRYDTALDMQGLFFSGLVAWLSGARRRIGLNRNREGNKLFLTEACVEGRDESRHAIEILQGFASALGVGTNSGELPAQDYLANAEADFAQRLLEGLPRPRVALNVGASTPYKQWPLENWSEVARSLGRSGASVVLLGGAAEVDQATEVEGLAEGGSRLRNLAGRTDLRQLAAVLARCELMISGDTGPLHIAGAVGTPTVALFGPTHPKRTGPYGGKNLVIWKQLACSPCYRHPTCNGRVDCLRAISAEEVLEKAHSLLTERVAV
jgi:lipopolysaccharide heptosyltransferase II